MKIRRKFSGLATLAFILNSITLPACTIGDDATAVSELLAETSPSAGVRFMYRGYKDLPELTLASYAVANSAGTGLDGSNPAPPGLVCTGEMIGPNIFMTAAHCGFNDDRAISFTYSTEFGTPDAMNRGVMRSYRWSGSCRRLVQSFADGVNSDLALYFCPDDPTTGLGPGDIFGWLDFDQSAPNIGQNVASVFTNHTPAAATLTPFPAPDLPGGTLQYGFGQVVLTSQQPCSTTDPPLNYNIPGQGGNSGSVGFNTVNWRATIGPLSVVGNSSCGTPSGRWARSIQDYVLGSRVRSGLSPSHIANANVTALGLNPANYASTGVGTLLDGDGDYVFDIQADTELTRGENTRNWYYLGFNSPRRNRLWTRDPVVSFLPLTNSGIARVNYTANTYKQLLRHTRLNLTPGATYRISVMTTTRSQGGSNPLSIGFCSVVGGSCQYSANRWLSTQAGTTQTFTSTGTTSASATAVYLDIDAHKAYDGDIFAVSIIQTNPSLGSTPGAAIMNFDTHDTRVNWRNDLTARAAVIVPDGPTTQTGTAVTYSNGSQANTFFPNWALYVERNTQVPSGYPARTNQLALTVGHRYSICFDHRLSAPVPTTGQMRVQSWNGSSWLSSLASYTFTPNTNWLTSCTSTFTVTAEESWLQFGFSGTSASGQNYLIDNLQVIEMP